jgi:hypothetical protein
MQFDIMDEIREIEKEDGRPMHEMYPPNEF